MSGRDPGSAMRVGIAAGSFAPVEGMRRYVAAAARRGFDSIWWQDHLMGMHSARMWSATPLAAHHPDPHALFDPFVAMAACADVSGDALMGTCVTDAVRRLPATVAQTALSLDHLAPGRIVVGLGAGEAMNFRPYGGGVSSPAAQLERAAREIRRFFDDPSPTSEGAVVGLRGHPSSSGPRLWVSAHGPKGIETVGRYADGWLTQFLSGAEWREADARVDDAAVRAGRSPADIERAAVVLCLTADDRTAAERALRAPAVKLLALMLDPARYLAAGSAHPLGGHGIRRLVPTTMGSALDSAVGEVPDSLVADYVAHGTAEDVAERVAELKGVDHVILWDVSALAHPDPGSLDRLAEAARIIRAHPGPASEVEPRSPG